MEKIKNKRRFIITLVLAFLFISVDVITPSLLSSFTADRHSNIVYAKSTTKSKSSSSGFKSGSFSSPKSSGSSSSSSKSSSGGFKSGIFSTPKSSSGSSSSKSSGSSSSSSSSGSSTKRSILPIPIPIPWGSSHSYYGSPSYGYSGGFFSSIFRTILIIIVIVIIYKIIKNIRRRF